MNVTDYLHVGSARSAWECPRCGSSFDGRCATCGYALMGEREIPPPVDVPPTAGAFCVDCSLRPAVRRCEGCPRTQARKLAVAAEAIDSERPRRLPLRLRRGE